MPSKTAKKVTFTNSVEIINSLSQSTLFTKQIFVILKILQLGSYKGNKTSLTDDKHEFNSFISGERISVKQFKCPLLFDQTEDNY